jgi:hypothetical protein
VQKWSAFFRTHFCTLARYLGDGHDTVARRNWFSFSEHICAHSELSWGGHDTVDRTIDSLPKIYKGPGIYLTDILISILVQFTVDLIISF